MDDEEKLKKSTNKGLLKGIAIGVTCTIFISTLFNFTTFASGSKYSDIDKKLAEINKLLGTNYVDEIGEEQVNEMYENIFRGYVAGVGDKYTTYMDNESFNQFLESTSGQYAGIGASVSNGKDDNYVTIVNAFPNSPAEKIGLTSGDKILSVNGEEVSGEDLDAAITLIKGEPGSEVKLSVLKTTGETVELIATREKIDVPTVEHKMLENNIGYVRLSAFDEVTSDQYKEAIDDLVSKNAKSLVIDLRDNPGGLLNVVCDIADSLLPKGVIVYTEDKNGKKDYVYSKDGELGLPIVVLVNEYSASASEVLTCALKDYKVATVVGEQSYGKGVVQSLFPMRDGSALKITISKYYSPNGYSINGTGVTPDIVVPFNEMEKGSAYNLPLEEDVQLQKAIEVLESK